MQNMSNWAVNAYQASDVIRFKSHSTARKCASYDMAEDQTTSTR